MKKVFISSKIGQERTALQIHGQIVYGKAHYSWKIIEKMYYDSLKMCGSNVERIDCPDIYQSNISKKLIDCTDDDIHICVKPIELIRPIFGIKNIFICGWEFPEIANSFSHEDPTYNHAHILRQADIIVCWSKFTAKNVKSIGAKSVTVMPPPVIEFIDNENAVIDNLTGIVLTQCKNPPEFKYVKTGEFIGKGRSIFFTVLNPFDKRKNLKNLITGFLEATKSNNNVKLIVKLVIDNQATVLVNIIEILKTVYDINEYSDKILFIGDELSSAQMSEIYKSSDFYLCGSSAEGLNLPLIEAMFQQCVPVSPACTAMADYISHDCAIVMPAARAKADSTISSLGDTIELSHFPPSATAIEQAVLRAAGMGTLEKAAKGEHAKHVVESQYGLQTFRRRAAKLGLLAK